MSVARDIIDNIVGELRGLNVFADVRLGGDAGGAVPRAAVEWLGEVIRPADDGSTRWHRLTLGIVVTAAAQTPGAAVDRALELCDLVRRRLQREPFRGGLAADLPCGRATEVGGISLTSGVKPPGGQVRLDVNCHFESTGDA